MKLSNNGPKHCLIGLCAAMLGLLSINAAHAQVFVTTPSPSGAVNEYSPSGSPISVPEITLSNPDGIAVLGSDMFIANSGTIAEYTTSGVALTNSSISSSSAFGIAAVASGLNDDLFVTSGTTVSEYVVNAASGALQSSYTLITGLANAEGIAVSNGDLFIASTGGNIGAPTSTSGFVNEYTISGSTANLLTPDLITGLNNPLALAISGNNLYVANRDGTGSTPPPDGSVGEYTISNGSVSSSNASLITGLYETAGVAVSGSNLYVLDDGNNGTVGSMTGTLYGYTLNSGGNVASSPQTLVTGLDYPLGIATVPEPLSVSLGIIVLALLGVLLRMRAVSMRDLDLADTRFFSEGQAAE